MTTIVKDRALLIQKPSSDLGLVERVAKGDTQALEELYIRYSPVLYTYLFHLVYEEPIAEELIQEVFIAVWKSAFRFRKSAAVKTWLFQIAHHLGVSWLRRKKLYIEYVQNIEQDPLPNMDEVLQEQWIKKVVSTALRRLSVEHRAVLELTYYYGLSYEETAEIVQCPIGTVKSRISYARRNLDHILRAAGVNSLSGE